MFESNKACLSERFRNIFATLDVGTSSFADIFSQSSFDVNAPRKGLTILFSSKSAAKEAGYILGSSWDGCNAITITQPDFTLLRTALALLKLELGCEEAEYCYREDFCDTLASSENGIAPPFHVTNISPEQGMLLFGDSASAIAGLRSLTREDSYFDTSQDNYNMLEIPGL